MLREEFDAFWGRGLGEGTGEMEEKVGAVGPMHNYKGPAMERQKQDRRKDPPPLHRQDHSSTRQQPGSRGGGLHGDCSHRGPAVPTPTAAISE